MLEQALGTETLIEKCLDIIEDIGDDPADWPIDTVPN